MVSSIIYQTGEVVNKQNANKIKKQEQPRIIPRIPPKISGKPNLSFCSKENCSEEICGLFFAEEL